VGRALDRLVKLECVAPERLVAEGIVAERLLALEDGRLPRGYRGVSLRSGVMPTRGHHPRAGRPTRPGGPASAGSPARARGSATSPSATLGTSSTHHRATDGNQRQQLGDGPSHED
jgi:hypothetical protein